jgi:lantibiotic biosynthesis protein
MVGQLETKRKETSELARNVADLLVARAGKPVRKPVRSELATGDPGIALALLYAHEILGEEDYRVAGRTLLHDAVRAVTERPVAGPGLLDGLAGLVWVLSEYAEREPRYELALHATTERLAGRVIALTPRRLIGRMRLSRYDLFGGAAGQLVALARAARLLGYRSTDRVEGAIARLTRYLLKSAEIADDGVPNWLVPPASYALPFFDADFPHGLYDPGMAHGIAGVLAALSAVADDRPDARIIRRKITALSDWLAWCRIGDAAGPAWPVLLRAEADTRVPVLDSHDEPGRTAWCHGAPGIADALFAAAAVTGRSGIFDLATAALDRVIRTPEADRRVTGAGLCHGKAGLLTAFARAHRWTGASRYLAARDDVARALGDLVDRERLFAAAGSDDGLLTGSAGVLLALLGAVDPSADWDRALFLTSPR